jgi:hypothetical protein
MGRPLTWHLFLIMPLAIRPFLSLLVTVCCQHIRARRSCDSVAHVDIERASARLSIGRTPHAHMCIRR